MKIFNFEFRISNKYVLPIVLFTVGLLTQPSMATDLQTATEQVVQSHENLLDVNDSTNLSPEEKLQKEISARKNIISDALALSLQEIDNLKKSLEELPKFESGSREAVLKEEFMADLDKFREYYETKQDELGKTIFFMLDAVKNFAKNIVDYRDTIYNPRTSAIVDFTLLFYNEEAISTAKARLSKITSNIKKLEKLGLVKTGYFKSGLDKTAALLEESEALNTEARNTILAVPAEVIEETGLPAEDGNSNLIISAPAPAGEANAVTDTEAVIDTPEDKSTVRDLLVKSLGNIKSAYETFVAIGKETQKILGIR